MNLVHTDQLSNPQISIIVVTYNNEHDLPDFFAALKQVQEPTFEVIIIDNASSDNTVSTIQKHWPQVRLICNSQNVGFGQACNQGAEQAQGDYIHFLNPDVRVTPVYLLRLVETFQEHPKLGILCPATLYPDSKLDISKQIFELQAALPGSALLIPHSIWNKIGGFDPAMFLYWEDTELCWRAWIKGWQVASDSRCWVYHLRGTSTGYRRWDAELAKSSIYTHVKLLRWRRVIQYTFVIFIKSIAKYRTLACLARLVVAYTQRKMYASET